MGQDFEIDIPDPDAIMSMDEAIKIACHKLQLPELGGPSGQGWSRYSIAQGCPHLYGRMFDIEGNAPSVPYPRTDALETGGLYHFLQALYYAPGLGPAVYSNNGLISAELYANRRGRKPRTITIPNDAADSALALLRELAMPLEAQLQASVDAATSLRHPDIAIVAAAEACFDEHTAYYGAGNEDVTPLAIEWWANNEALNYTCRYDMIGRIGAQDPLGLPEGAIVVYERKTAKWLSDIAREGWFLDGEVLGEILNWQPSGCEQLFGPLHAVVVDVVGKDKKHSLWRTVVPATIPPVKNHGKWIRWMQSQIRLWQASGVYPQFFTHCFDKGQKCVLWDECAGGGCK